MARKSAVETAQAAAELYAARDDEDLLGGEVVEVEPRPGAVSTVVSVRLNEEDLRRVEAAADRAGKKLSTFVREAALVAALDDGEREAIQTALNDALTSARMKIEQVQVAVMKGTAVPVSASEAVRKDSGRGGQTIEKKSGDSRSPSGRVADETAHKAG